MPLTHQQILDRLSVSGRLPTPKGVALEVINLSQRDDVSGHEIGHLIAGDPGLSQRVIKAANVLLGAPSRPVITVEDAVTVLGMRALRQLVLGIALVVDYRHGPCANFDYRHFWLHSLLTAIAARHLVERQRLVAAEEFFVLGLLGQVGQLAMATVFPSEYAGLLEKDAVADDVARLGAERAAFGFDQADVSVAMLADMNFPPLFQALVQHFRRPQESNAAEGSREWRLLHLLHLAGLMADVWTMSDAERVLAAGRLRDVATRLAIEEGDLLRVAETCAHDWHEWAVLFGLGSQQLPDMGRLLTAHEGAPPPVAVPDAAADDFKMRVLVVEDDRSMRNLLQQLLVSAGHQVHVAASGEEALCQFGVQRPQLVIIDDSLPVPGGVALCRALREQAQNGDLYLMVVTADNTPDKLVEAFEAGADDHLLKPVTPRIFFARLRAAQRVVRLQAELAFDRERMLRYASDLSAANERLQQQALTDALTDLPNRRYAMERLEQEWALAQRGARRLSCLMVDIDHFKSVNDRFGHHVGDEALQRVAETLRRTARTQDVVCRYGGEEFLVICPDSAAADAWQCAERMRQAVSELLLEVPGGKLRLTLSAGVAEKVARHAALPDLLAEADRNLYAAKSGGRNRTVLGS